MGQALNLFPFISATCGKNTTNACRRHNFNRMGDRDRQDFADLSRFVI
jgi:hypothetical protein